MRGEVWLLAVVITLGAGIPTGSGYPVEPDNESQRPNIVFILADDLGWTDVNAFDPLQRGYYETPHIDSLAAEGMMFTQAYTNAANCAPTRAALMSGQYYPHQPIYHVGSPSQGEMIPAKNARHLPPEKITLAETLGREGYRTALIGKWHIGTPSETGPREQGFDVNVGGYMAGNPGNWEGGYFHPENNPFIPAEAKGRYLTDYLTQRAVEFIEASASRPFYLQLSYYTPHVPLQAPEQRIARYSHKEGRHGHNDASYAAMIESLDRGIGQVVEVLEQSGLAEETIVVFYSDNGGNGGFKDLGRENNGVTDNSPLKAGKGSFYEGGIRVPLIVRWPGVTRAGSRSDEPVIGIDFYPTLLDAAGIEPPSDYRLDGTNIRPVLENPETTLEREYLYWHFPGYPNAAWRTSPVSVIRSGPWKLMKFYEDGHLELYNINRDRGEQDNLAQKRSSVRNRLHDQLRRWLSANDAPMPRHRSE